MAARVRTWNCVKFETVWNTKNSNMHCTCCVDISHFVNVAKCARGRCSTF